MSSKAALAEESRVEATFGISERQDRLTVAFRFVLYFPHSIVLVFRAVIVEVLLVVAWFAALFSGKVPDRVAHYLARYITYVTRVNAYHLLMLDTYPPFSLDREDYPVQVAIHPVRLNRWAVLFRSVIALPASIVAVAFTFGAAIVSIASWFIVLVTGKLPDSLHEANAAALRYSTRYTAYAFMVSSAYPHQLYGDAPTGGGAEPPSPIPAGWPSAPVAAPTDGDVEAAPLASAPFPSVPFTSPPIVDPAGYAPSVPTTDSRWPLVLSRTGRRVLTLFGVIGPVMYAAIIVLAFTLGGAVSSNPKIALPIDHSVLASNVSSYNAEIATCTSNLDCVHAADTTLADAFASFGSKVASLSFPSAATGDASTLVSESARFESVLRVLARTDRVDYPTTAAGLTQVGSDFDSTYAKVVADLD